MTRQVACRHPLQAPLRTKCMSDPHAEGREARERDECHPIGRGWLWLGVKLRDKGLFFAAHLQAWHL